MENTVSNTEIVQLDENTWRIENGFVRFFLLAGSERAALIDSGASCPEARELARSLTALPTVLINTHGDGDHVSGNGGFESYYMFPEDYTGCGMEKKCPGAVCHPLADGMRMDLGGRELEILAIPGHTAGSAAVLDREKRVLYSGDSVQTGQIFMFGGHRRPEAFAGSLRRLLERSGEFDAVRPCHSDPEIPADSVEKVLADWERVCRGELTGESADIHGARVLSLRGQYCGFFCDLKNT